MRNALRFLLICAVLPPLTSVTLAATDKPDKADRAGKPEKAEREKGDKERGKGDKAKGGPVDAPGTDAPAQDVAAATPVTPPAEPLVEPGAPAHPEHTKFAQRVGAMPSEGTITVKLPGSDEFAPLTAGASLPVGSIVDASNGLVEISSEAGPGGAEQNAVVTGSMFRVGQDASGGVTDLALVGGDFSDCGDGASAASKGGATARAAGKRKPKSDIARGLWAAGKGRFRTKGRHSAATVRGTRWAIVDRCNSTTVKVFDGIVDVNDFGLGRTVQVRAGERHVARERRG